MAAKPKFDPELHDENPEWTKRDFAKAKPASEVLPPEVIAQFKNKGGRPRIENPKEAVKLRIDADVLAKFRESGPGWQTQDQRHFESRRVSQRVAGGKQKPPLNESASVETARSR